MRPNLNLITIDDNLNKIKQLLSELVIQPRINAVKWSKITKQTPNLKVGYPGQHLASLITGVPGTRTGARGKDLADGSEVKSCSRIDQLDKCNSCKSPVARLEVACPECGSIKIKRNNDSKWLFTIRSERDLNELIKEIERVILVIADYPNFEDQDYDTLRIQSFEIWPTSDRHTRFRELMYNYYNHIYLTAKRKKPEQTPAPKNFWPYSYQFYICNPILTFSCLVHRAISETPSLEILKYVKPDEDRSFLDSVAMPTNLLNQPEKENLRLRVGLESLPTSLDESLKQYLPLRNQ
ncbi:MamI family restriction endonuclease [Ancylothrix sp. C2]|uniref:MamI family restriction endonuclease n=1 Tax=Ancylothrix sp. D3o TaxID=2953691 RepID=UPI0021BB4484|nr:MamI family restriction endonuclease [Ancylothrix sp. D3o]MCT7949885.1 MamI family restriction endonuclease [Ancylothrix sp. D3o]